MCLSLADAKDIATIVGVAVALITFIKAMHEYRQQGIQKRAQSYFDVERKFLDDKNLRDICILLDADDTKLSEVPSELKLQFLGFYEQVALMLNSKLIEPEVAHYMFGYYAVRCIDSTNFWKGEDKESPYWALFRHFAQRMKEFEKEFHFDNSKLRF
ncbi:MAG: hypothetical protein LWW80_03810 [Thiomonas sp.]|nr:hypothetical protein [Thiomonas sp.]